MVDIATSQTAIDRIEAIYRAEGARIERALVGSFGDRELAGDAISEAFAQLIRRGDEVNDPLAWIWRASFSIARGMVRPKHAEFESGGLSELNLASVSNPGSTNDAGYPIDVIQALQELSLRQRQAVVLHYYAGFSLREVADITGSSRQALKVHLSRARQRLQIELNGASNV